MKIYISVDIEGVAGITHWNEAEKNHADWAEFREVMTCETLAAIEGARAGGASEIWIKDAHDSGRNLITTLLPPDVTLIREWSGHPYSMIQELDESFAGLVMIGYHAGVGSEGNSLAHTLNTRTHMMTLNGTPVSEFRLCALAAATFGVPTLAVSGDKALMAEIAATNPAITRIPVKEGRGQSTISMTPTAAQAAIRAGVEKAVRGDKQSCLLPLPDSFVLELTYVSPTLAYEKSFYPGCTYMGQRTNRVTCHAFFDVMRALRFIK
jgi:D-amino peptidase